MALSLKESQASTELADRLYPFLPGKAHPYADQCLSFPGVAARLGLGRYWPGGSKLPAIASLLTATLELERGRFCSLVLAVVQQGMIYRRNKDPIAREEIDDLNAIIGRIGYKIPELHDPDFLGGLPRRGKAKASSPEAPSAQAIAALQAKLTELRALNPIKRGFAFEPFLSELFDLYHLAPRGAFRLVGEQIDGSFELDSEVYLLEARWRNQQAANTDVLAFAGKIAGKARWSRGLFVSYAGFSADGLRAFGQGRPTNLIGLDGLDLYHVLSGTLDLREVLRRKVRRAAETNRVFVPVRELFVNVT
jgi:hypothetical protein